MTPAPGNTEHFDFGYTLLLDRLQQHLTVSVGVGSGFEERNSMTVQAGLD